MMSDTDLYELSEMKVIVAEFSPSNLAVLTLDQRIFLFNSRTLKLIKSFNESIDHFQLSQSKGDYPELLKVPATDVVRRVLIEHELEKEWANGNCLPSLQFDETGDYLCYATPCGIKFLNLKTNRLSRVTGKNESQRYLSLALF